MQQHSSIGNVPVQIINQIADTLESTDYNTLKQLVWDGKWAEYSMEYIHPEDSLSTTRCFKEIQMAFINAYC